MCVSRFGRNKSARDCHQTYTYIAENSGWRSMRRPSIKALPTTKESNRNPHVTRSCGGCRLVEDYPPIRRVNPFTWLAHTMKHGELDPATILRPTFFAREFMYSFYTQQKTHLLGGFRFVSFTMRPAKVMCFSALPGRTRKSRGRRAVPPVHSLACYRR